MRFRFTAVMLLISGLSFAFSGCSEPASSTPTKPNDAPQTSVVAPVPTPQISEVESETNAQPQIVEVVTPNDAVNAKDDSNKVPTTTVDTPITPLHATEEEDAKSEEIQLVEAKENEVATPKVSVETDTPQTAVPVEEGSFPFLELISDAVVEVLNGPESERTITEHTPDEIPALPVTHKPVHKLKPLYNGKKININTFCLAPEGNLVLSCGGEVHQISLTEEEKKLLEEEGEETTTAQTTTKDNVLFFYTPEREFVKTILAPFKVTAMTYAPDGTLFIGGSGQLAKISKEGTVLQKTGTPQIKDHKEFRSKLIEQAKKEQAEMAEMFKESLEIFEQQLEGLLKVKEEDRSRGEKRTIRALQAQVNIYKQQMGLSEVGMEEAQLEMMLQMKLRVPAVSITKQDIFVTVPSLEGYGFEVWRMDHNFEKPELVASDLSGCCGQMDVQARDDKFFVAENGRFRVTSFDRNGEKLNSFGKADRTSKQGFGSCCNPMNVYCCSNGDILTSESSVGNIKRYSPEGKLLANIGHVKLKGGCKNVAIQYDETRDRYYMMDLPNSTIVTLLPLSEAPEFTDEEKEIEKAKAGLGKTLIGKWKRIKAENKDQETDNAAEEEINPLAAQIDLSEYPGTPKETMEFKADYTFTSKNNNPNVDSVFAGANIKLTWIPVKQKEKTLFVDAQTAGDETLSFEILFLSKNEIEISTKFYTEVLEKMKYTRDDSSK